MTMRVLRRPEELEPESLARPDAISFVGATSPQGQLLPLVVGVGRLRARAKAEGADLVVVDTSGLVSGVYGQLLKYHKIELLEPDVVIGLQRGEELDPILGIVRRFFKTEVVELSVLPDIRHTSVDERAAYRERPDEAKALLPADAPKGVDAAEFAAWTSVARVLLNLDEFITRE